RFQKPTPFQPDIAVAIDRIMERKLDALDTLESQFYEGGALGAASLIPADPAKQRERRRKIRDGFADRNRSIADRYRSTLGDWYGKLPSEKVQYAEAFEICEYG